MTALRTARLTGRPIRARDARFAAALFGDDQVGRHVAESRRPWSRQLAQDRALAFAAHWSAHGFGLLLWETAGEGGEAGAAGAGPPSASAPPGFGPGAALRRLPGRALAPAPRKIGVAGLQFCVLSGRGAVEASFAFLPEFWGRGLAHEAMAAVLRQASGVCREIEAVAHHDNVRAAALLARLGFAPREGEAAGAPCAEAGPGATAEGAAPGSAPALPADAAAGPAPAPGRAEMRRFLLRVKA